MKLLICTQKVDIDDPVLGFFHRWLMEFAKDCEKLTVICLKQGEFSLPDNVKILSLGKENSKWLNCYMAKLLYCWRFYKYIFRERKNYDAVLVHMNPEYVVLGGLFWRLLGKKIGLWYVHRQVNFKLRMANFFSHHLFSVSVSSINIKSKKLHFLGHGIDTEQFRCINEKKHSCIFRIISVGRITRIKNLDILVKAAALLKSNNSKNFVIELIGEPVTPDDWAYKGELERLVRDSSLEETIKFSGAKHHEQLPDIYCQSDLQVNLAPTGGLDKAVLEAIACSIPVVVTNKSFYGTLGIYADRLLFKQQDVNDLAAKISFVMNGGVGQEVGLYLRQQTIELHDLAKLIKKIIISLS